MLKELKERPRYVIDRALGFIINTAMAFSVGLILGSILLKIR